MEWSPKRSLELLHEIRVFMRANAVDTMGGDMQKWILVARNMANPDGLNEYLLAYESMAINWMIVQD
ncbi:unnamed protein product [Calypogeia fissa]